MPAATTKANYKSFEAQARMVRAMVAAHPEVKWNYKEIVACYGSDMTDHALNHRFRRVRAQALVITEARKQGFDIKGLATDEKALPATQEAVDKQNIAKYFGQSTADGIQFQFRGIKKDAELLRQAANNGGDVVNALSLGSGASAPATPSKPTPARARGSRTTSTKRRAETFIKRAPSDDEDEDIDSIESYSEETPSKRVKTAPTRGRKAGTPGRMAAAKADATIAAAATAAVQYDAVESPPEVQTPSAPEIAPPMRNLSIFGNVEPVERKPIINQSEPSIYNSALSRDGSFNSNFDSYVNDNYFDDYNGAADGEC